MSKKTLIIIGAALIGLIFIILIMLVALGNKNETKVVDFSMANTTINNTNTTNRAVENIVEDPVNKDEREKIEGEITYAQTSDGGMIPIPPTFSYIEGDSRNRCCHRRWRRQSICLGSSRKLFRISETTLWKQWRTK